MLDFARLPRPVGNKMTGDTPTAAQLQAISDPFVRSLAGLGRLRTYPKNTVFITEGDSSDSVFVILSGRVKVFISDTEGHEMILDTQGPGEYVGEMALDGKPRSASVMTLEATTFSVVGRDLASIFVQRVDLATGALVGSAAAPSITQGVYGYSTRDGSDLVSLHFDYSNVLRMIVRGMSNKEIASGLEISENTVKTHVKNIFDKIGVSDRTSAATLAIKRGLVRLEL